MDDRGKKIEVNVSSLVDLKAELLRKQEEFRRQKLENSSGTIQAKALVKKPTVWSKKNIGVLERAQNDVEEKQAETDVLSRVKSSLAAKSEIYNKMASGGALLDEDCSKEFLVDFEKKSLDVITEKKRAEKARVFAEEARNRKEDEEEQRLLAEKVEEPSNPDDHWVDYVDSFGRTRRCLKKDLPRFKDSNKALPTMQTKEGNSLHLLSADMKRELQRQEWEKQEDEALNNPVGPTHYSDVRFNENREHGVGYFEFAKDEQTRQQQMETLKKLRKQTEEQQLKTDWLKEKRKALMQARLAKVKQRKTVQDIPDLNINPLAEEEKISKDEATTADDVGLSFSSTELTRGTESLPQKVTTVREWDRGKRFDENSWLTERRDERLNEFAPPSIYSQNANTSKSPWQPRVQNKSDIPSKTKTCSDSGSFATVANVTRRTSTNSTKSDNLPRPSETRESSSGQSRTEEYTPSQTQTTESVQCSTLEYDISMKLSAIRNNLIAPPDSAPTGEVSIGTIDSHHSKTFAADATWMPMDHIPSNPMNQTETESNWNDTVTWSYMTDTPSAMSVPESMMTHVNAHYDVQHSGRDIAATAFDITSLDTDPNKFVISSPPEYTEYSTAPQPAHYASAPSLPQPKQPKYERVFLHDLPPTLPAPPTAGSVAALQYPSQEEVIGPRRKHDRQVIDEQAAIKSWFRQFDSNWRASKALPMSTSLPGRRGETCGDQTTEEPTVKLKPKNIPFASPYIQIGNSEKNVVQDAEAAKFDPSKPPPPPTF